MEMVRTIVPWRNFNFSNLNTLKILLILDSSLLFFLFYSTGRPPPIINTISFFLRSVAQLKEAIERECGVVSAHQVLLMSGGESLEPTARVCSYSAGTDTNPIYLFSKAAIESHLPPTPSIDYGSGERRASSPVNFP